MMKRIMLAAFLMGISSSNAMQDGPYNDRSPWNGAPGDFGNMNMPGEPMNNLPATLNRPDRDWHRNLSPKTYDFQDKIIDVTERDRAAGKKSTEEKKN